MKKLSIICFALIASASAWAQKDMGNSKVNTDFSKFHSFTWAKQDPTIAGTDGYDIYYIESDPVYVKQKSAKNKSAKANVAEPYVYSYTVIIPARDEAANGVIMDAITSELEGRGYQENSGSGDLIVAYQVLDRKATLHGYNNDDPITISGGEQVRTEDDQQVFVLQPGTLMISLIDAKTSEVVWDGFSKDLVSNNSFVTDEVKLKQAVHDVFQQFKYSAGKARR
ncbi:MAG: DUF4136 domain-containing protein [Bacteroidota bacterium]